MNRRNSRKTNILFMDQFLSEQEVRERRLRRAKVRMASVASGRALRLLRPALNRSVSVDARSLKPSLNGFQPINSAFIIHRVEV